MILFWRMQVCHAIGWNSTVSYTHSLLCVAKVNFDPAPGNKGLRWLKLLDNMAESGVYLNNYPYIMLPNKQRKSSAKSKGLGNLYLSHRKRLIEVFLSEEHPCRFVTYRSGAIEDKIGMWLSVSRHLA